MRGGIELIVKDPQTICIVGCPLSTFWCSDCRGVLSGNITGKSQNRRYTGNWLILTVVSYSFSSRVCPAEGRLNVQLDLVVWVVSKMAGIKSLFPGSLMPYACDVITTNVTSSKILVLSSPFLKRWKAIAIFSFAYRRMRFLILGRSVGLKKKKTKRNHKKSRNRRPWYPRTTLKVNIHIFGLTKCTIYCEECSCFCSCFSLCYYYAHFSD